MNEMTQTAGQFTSPFRNRYDNYIGGQFVAPKSGAYFDNITPITGAPVCEVARSDAADVEAALDAAHAAREAWGKTSAAERSNLLLKIADVYDDEVDNAVTALTSILEPVMIVILALVVGSVVFALFLPLIKIIQTMGGGAA